MCLFPPLWPRDTEQKGRLPATRMAVSSPCYSSRKQHSSADSGAVQKGRLAPRHKTSRRASSSLVARRLSVASGILRNWLEETSWGWCGFAPSADAGCSRVAQHNQRMPVPAGTTPAKHAFTTLWHTTGLLARIVRDSLQPWQLLLGCKRHG